MPSIWSSGLTSSVERAAWYLCAVGILLLIADCVLLGCSIGVVQLPGFPGELSRAKSVGEKVLGFYLDQTENRPEDDRDRLVSIVDGARATLVQCTSLAAVADTIWEVVSRFSEESYSLSSKRAKQEIVDVVEGAARRVRFDGRALVSISTGGSGVASVVSVGDSAHLLNDDDLLRIKRVEAEYDLAEVVDIRVNGREAFPIAPATMREEIASLEEDNQRIAESIISLRRLSGLEELTGPGVVLFAYDASEGYSYHEIVHDQDVRQMIDLLLEAGALGVEVGGQRITVRSSVRCAGPIVLVNQRPIAVNPVVVKAVGEPEALRQGVREMTERFAVSGKRLEIRCRDIVNLSAAGSE